MAPDESRDLFPGALGNDDPALSQARADERLRLCAGAYGDDGIRQSVLRRPVDVIDDDEVAGPSGRHELQPELFLQRGNQSRYI